MSPVPGKSKYAPPFASNTAEARPGTQRETKGEKGRDRDSGKRERELRTLTHLCHSIKFGGSRRVREKYGLRHCLRMREIAARPSDETRSIQRESSVLHNLCKLLQ